MIYESIGIEALQRRYSRIIHALKRANLLTQGEAVSCVLAHLRKDEWAGEAVNHAGGVVKCINRAIRSRRLIIDYPRKSRMSLMVNKFD